MGAYPSLAAERDRCVWLREKGVSVPEVVDYGTDGAVEWLVTVALPGEPSTAERYLENPRHTIRALAEGLRAFHTVDPSGCPFDHGLAATFEHIGGRVLRGEVDPAGFNSEHRRHSVETALERLTMTRPESEDLVLTHGDYCFPNVLLDAGGVVGYLDVGEAGVGDRWRDLAVATWSTTWNVGPGWQDAFLDAYGIEWDKPRRDFFRLLYDLES